jgi:hypothetical protein
VGVELSVGVGVELSVGVGVELSVGVRVGLSVGVDDRVPPPLPGFVSVPGVGERCGGIGVTSLPPNPRHPVVPASSASKPRRVHSTTLLARVGK